MLKIFHIFLFLVLIISCDNSSNIGELSILSIQTKPLNGSKIAGPTITFEWLSVAGVKSYVLEVSNSIDFSNAPLFIDEDIKPDQTSYTLPVPFLEIQKSYYWRITTKFLNSNILDVSSTSSFFFVYANGIHFQDESLSAGINHISPSFGVSWGDFNGDGWLDIWSGNHFSKPSLYINQRDGSFKDIASLWNSNLSDSHGAAWADLNDDGKDELLQLSGKAIKNRLIKNINGTIVEDAIGFGLDIPAPRGRTPLWLDWDNDRKYDIVLTRLQSELEQPFILHNDNGVFTDYSSIVNITMGDANYAQMADLNGDRKLDLIFHNRTSFPGSVYDITTVPFQNILPELSIPTDTSFATYDTVIADLDNNLRNDIFVVKKRFDIELFQRQPKQLDAKIILTTNFPVKKYSFVSANSLEISIYLFNGEDLESQVFMGINKISADNFLNTIKRTPISKKITLILDPIDPRVEGQLDFTNLEQDMKRGATNSSGVFIGYDVNREEWQVISSFANEAISIVIKSNEAITNVKTGPYWKNMNAKAPLNLYIQSEKNNYLEDAFARGLTNSSCGAVVGADFDNDMDIDLYLVCTNGVSNIPNRLFKNDGSGHFVEVINAAGASGSSVGHGENVAFADYDKDGFIDLFVVNGGNQAPFHNGPQQLFHNIPNINHWIEIDLKSRFSALKGLGATVIIETKGVRQMREQNGGYHRYSQNTQLIHFGLANNDFIETMTIIWPSGLVQVLSNIQADQILTVIETGTSGCSDGVDNNNNQLIDFPEDSSCISLLSEEL